MTYGLKLPIVFLSETGDYDLVSDVQEEVKQNVKLLFVTKPGEKVSDPLYGIGVDKYLFEPDSVDNRDEIITEVRSQMDKYLPFVSVDDIKISNDTPVNSIYMMVVYSVPSLGIETEKLVFQSEADL